MLYDKPIEQITFDDITAFCTERRRESIHLDYKREIDSSIARTIAAMANTWGGLILVGVDEDDSRPRLPVAGIAYEEHLRERVNDIILGNITPPVFPEIQICRSTDNQRALIVVRVAQSNLTPHAIRGNTRVYLRTDTSNQPEELATVDRILWLVDRRQRSASLKEMFYQRADERWISLCAGAGVTARHGELIFGMSPLYPFESLVAYRRLLQEIPNAITARGWSGSSFPPEAVRVVMVPGKDGAVAFLRREHSDYVAYEEINEYGFFYHREDIVMSERPEQGAISHRIYLHTILMRLDLFLEAMGRFYEIIGYWGQLALTVTLHHDGSVVFINLPAPRNHYRIENETPRPVDHNMEFHREFTTVSLREQRSEIIASLISEIGWAAGFPHITVDSVKVLLRENGRAA
jgi:Schlafen, AlbA_2